MKSSLLVAATLLTFAAPAVVSMATVQAACSNIGNNAANGASSAARNGHSDPSFCTSPSDVDGSGIGNIASKIVNIFSIIVGAVAVIMVIYGGFRYVTSGGDSGRVGNAKNTLIYAVVGLIIVALAQVIVRFVLNFSSDSVTQT